MSDGDTLFEIDRELDSLLDQIEEEAEETGSASPELLERFQRFCEAESEKVDRIGRFLSLMDNRLKYCRQQADRFQTRARSADAKIVGTKIWCMVAENPTWGAPRIHGELKMLGFDLSERTVLRWIRKAPRNPEPAKRWTPFLNNHREAIAAMDFFTVPTLTFGVLYCFFVIAHDRRRILHCNVTRYPTNAWVVQQLREAFLYDSAPGSLIFDRGAQFNKEVLDTVKNSGVQPKQTSYRSLWQNGVAGWWVGNCRRNLLDHVIVLNERHLKRLMNDYIR